MYHRMNNNKKNSSSNPKYKPVCGFYHMHAAECLHYAPILLRHPKSIDCNCKWIECVKIHTSRMLECSYVSIRYHNSNFPNTRPLSTYPHQSKTWLQQFFFSFSSYQMKNYARFYRIRALLPEISPIYRNENFIFTEKSTSTVRKSQQHTIRNTWKWSQLNFGK